MEAFMNKRLSVLAILTVLAAPAWAGGLGIGASFWSTDEADDGSGVGGRLAIDLGESLDLDVHISFLEDFFIDTPTTPPFELEVTPIDVGISWGFGTRSRVTPRLGGGLSYVMIEVTGSNIDTEVDDELGFYGLLGVDFAIGPRGAIYLEGLYRTTEAELRDFGLNQFDRQTFTATGAAANVGVMFTW
jgi:hypothetical protein